MSDKSVSWSITGDSSSYTAAMERAARATSDASGVIKNQFDNVGKAFEAVQGRLIAITAVVAGGAFFKEAIAASNKLTGETMSLSRRLVMTASDASALNTALGDIGTDSETYLGAFQKFAQQLRTNESGLQAMGLQTRDSNGHLRDSNELFREALQTVGQYKPGLDQTTAAMQLFGEGVDNVMKLQRLNNGVLEEARKKNEELGLTITQEGVEASKAYKAAMNDVGDVLTAVQNAVGQAVMPVFTQLANYFASTGPTVVAVFKGALTGLLLVFRAIEWSVKAVAAFCFELFSTVVDQFRNVGAVLSAVLRGDVRGALTAIGDFNGRFYESGRNLFAATNEGWQDAVAGFSGDLDRIWGRGTEVAAPKGGTKQQGDFKKDKDKEEKDPSRMKYYEAALDQERRLATERDALRGMSKQQELDFWNTLLQTTKLSTGDQLSVQKKVTEARIEIMRDEARASNELGKVALNSWEQRELGKVATDEEVARNRLALGQMTQAQLLQQEEQFELRRVEIRRTALEAEKATLDPTRDPVQVAQIQARLEQLEQEHQMRLRQIRGQVAVESAAEQSRIWGDLGGRMSSLWDQGVNAMMNSTLTWSGALRAVGAQIVGWFANSVVKPQIVSWIFGEQAKTGATVAGTALRLGTEALAAAKSVMLWAAAAAKNIMANAWAAMAAAWQAMAGIPIIGPALAVGAAAVTFAGVAALAGKVMSAEGGFDIPSGVNPMTQLHEKEMVLPAKHADVIRGLADGQGGGMNWNPTFELRATPMRGNFFLMHRDDLAEAFSSMKRDKAIR